MESNKLNDLNLKPRARFTKQIVKPLGELTRLTWELHADKLLAQTKINTPRSEFTEYLSFQYGYIAFKNGMGEPGWYLSVRVKFWNSQQMTKSYLVKPGSQQIPAIVANTVAGLKDILAKEKAGKLNFTDAHCSIEDGEEYEEDDIEDLAESVVPLPAGVDAMQRYIYSIGLDIVDYEIPKPETAPALAIAA